MKTRNFLIVMMLLLFVAPASAFAKIEVHLFDFSGSLASCNSLMQSNLMQVNRAIDNLGKNDRFFFFGYKSKGKPILLAEMQMPSKRGAKNRNMILAKNKLRKQLSENLAAVESLMNNSGYDTDIIGAINYALLFVGDLSQSLEGAQLFHYSDGIHTSGTGRFEVSEYQDYLRRLNKRLERARLVKPVTFSELNWNGGICSESMDLVTNDMNLLQSELRNSWATFLKNEAPGMGVTYRLSY